MAAVPPQLTSGGPVSNSVSNPQSPALTIGGLALLNNEHPDKLAFGLEQRQAIHELIGGGRQVQDLGPQPSDITWPGTFWDEQAAGKVQTLKRMQAAGNAVTLSWYNDSYSVLIKKFTPTWRHESRCDYELTVTVVADLSGTYTQGTAVSLDSQTLAMYSNAQLVSQAISGTTNPVGVTALDPSVYSNVSVLGTQLNNATPLAQASPSTISQITATINSMQQSVGPYLESLQGVMATYSTAIPSSLQSLYYNAQKLNNLLQLIMDNATVGQAPNIQQTGGGVTLFHLASQYYGDPTLATVIKQANGFKSMLLPGGVIQTLKLPPAQTNGLQ